MWVSFSLQQPCKLQARARVFGETNEAVCAGYQVAQRQPRNPRLCLDSTRLPLTPSGGQGLAAARASLSGASPIPNNCSEMYTFPNWKQALRRWRRLERTRPTGVEGLPCLSCVAHKPSGHRVTRGAHERGVVLDVGAPAGDGNELPCGVGCGTRGYLHHAQNLLNTLRAALK